MIDKCLIQTNVPPSLPTLLQSKLPRKQSCAGETGVKMAVLIRRRIRAVVFNQSRQWQNLWHSRGDCDDDSCWRGKHRKYTCTLICSRWSWAYSAMSVLRAAPWEKISVLQKHMRLCGHAAGIQRAGDIAMWYCHWAMTLGIAWILSF